MEILLKLPEQLKELMLTTSTSVSDLAKKIGVNESTITRYLQGVRAPSFKNFVKLVEAFNCSADFLLGIIEYPPENTVFYPIPPFHQQFCYLMEKHGISQYALHQKTNFSYDNFKQWRKGSTAPYPDNLIKLADAFECSIDYLIGHVR